MCIVLWLLYILFVGYTALCALDSCRYVKSIFIGYYLSHLHNVEPSSRANKYPCSRSYKRIVILAQHFLCLIPFGNFAVYRRGMEWKAKDFLIFVILAISLAVNTASKLNPVILGKLSFFNVFLCKTRYFSVMYCILELYHIIKKFKSLDLISWHKNLSKNYFAYQ